MSMSVSISSHPNSLPVYFTDSSSISDTSLINLKLKIKVNYENNNLP